MATADQQTHATIEPEQAQWLGANQHSTEELVRLLRFTMTSHGYLKLKKLVGEIKLLFNDITDSDIRKVHVLKSLLSEFTNFQKENPEIFQSNPEETLEEKFSHFTVMNLYFGSIPEIQTIGTKLHKIVEDFYQKYPDDMRAIFERLSNAGYIKD